MKSPEELFEWFTTEVVYSDEIYADDTLATARYRNKIWELAKSLGLNCILDKPYDAMWIKQEENKREILLTSEHENAIGWERIEEDFDKLVQSKARIKFGVFYINELTAPIAETRLQEYLNKMKEMIAKTYPKQEPKEEWLLIIGITFVRPEEHTWYHGYKLEGNEWREFKRKEIK